MGIRFGEDKEVFKKIFFVIEEIDYETMYMVGFCSFKGENLMRFKFFKVFWIIVVWFWVR